jgi:hypothetical protein
LPNCQVSNHMFSQTLLQKPGNAGCTITRLPQKKNKSLSQAVPEIWQWSGTNVQETKQPFALLNFPLFILACFWCINHLLMVLNPRASYVSNSCFPMFIAYSNILLVSPLNLVGNIPLWCV